MNFLKNHFFVIFLSAILIISLAPLIAMIPLNNWDECVYAEYAKQMKINNNYLIYYWNGKEVFEKPPLYGILLQIPFFLGINEFTARIFSLIFGLGTIILVYFYSYNYLSKLVAVFSLLIFSQSLFFISSFIVINIDIIASFFIFLGFYLFTSSIKHKKFRYFSFMTGLVFGLAILIRGLIVLIFLLAMVISTFLIFRSDKKSKYLKILIFILMASLIITIPWHIYAIKKYGYEFIKVYFFDNIFFRSINSIFITRPIFYYFYILARDSFPWFLLIFYFIFYFISRISKVNFDTSITKINRERIFIITFTLISILLLTIAETRMRIYVIMFYPFYTITLAILFEIIYLKTKKAFFLLIFLFFLTFVKFLIPNYHFTYANNNDEFIKMENILLKLKYTEIEEIEYLVSPRWRKFASYKNIIPAQLFYGDKPCLIFYSGKKFNIYYDTDSFRRRIFRGVKSLFLMSKEDYYLIKDLPVEIIENNSYYILFEN